MNYLTIGMFRGELLIATLKYIWFDNERRGVPLLVHELRVDDCNWHMLAFAILMVFYLLTLAQMLSDEEHWIY